MHLMHYVKLSLALAGGTAAGATTTAYSTHTVSSKRAFSTAPEPFSTPWAPTNKTSSVAGSASSALPDSSNGTSSKNFKESSMQWASTSSSISIAGTSSSPHAISSIHNLSAISTASSTRGAFTIENISSGNETSLSDTKFRFRNDSGITDKSLNKTKLSLLRNDSVTTNTSLTDTHLTGQNEIFRAMIDFTNFADLPVWEGAPKRGGFQLVLGLELVTFIAPSLADQTCANGINKRGPSACTSMKCVERTVIAALRRLSKSGSPSLLGALSQIRPFNLPAYPLEWASSIEQITSLVTSEDLFSFWWDAVSPRWFNGLIDAIILAIFTAEVVHLTDFQASLRTMKITTSDYTCPIPTETFKSCPSMTLTTLYPTLGTSLDLIACGIPGCFTTSDVALISGQYGVAPTPTCQPGTPYAGCPCCQTSEIYQNDSMITENDMIAQAKVLQSMYYDVYPMTNCSLTSQEWGGRTQSFCACGTETSVHYPTMTGKNTALACAYSTTTLPNPLPTTCTILPSIDGPIRAPCTCDNGNLIAETSWLVNSITTWECSTGQTPPPTPTVTQPASWTSVPSSAAAYSWTVFAGDGCLVTDFPIPSTAAMMTGSRSGAMLPCQSIQAASYYGRAIQMAANTAAAGHCVYAYTNPECTGWEVLKWCPTFSRGGLTTTTTCVANVDFERSTDWGVEDDGYIMGVEVY